MEGSISRNTEQGCTAAAGGGSDDDDSPVIKMPCTPAGSQEDNILSSWMLMEDYNDGSTVDELMKFLDDTSASTTATKVKFIDNPYSSPLIFQSSSSYITINGNEETCGSSFSDWESSVMASVHMGGFANGGRVDFIDGFEFRDWFQGGQGDGAWILNNGDSAARGERSGGVSNSSSSSVGGGDGLEWDLDCYYECFAGGDGGALKEL